MILYFNYIAFNNHVHCFAHSLTLCLIMINQSEWSGKSKEDQGLEPVQEQEIDSGRLGEDSLESPTSPKQVLSSSQKELERNDDDVEEEEEDDVSEPTSPHPLHDPEKEGDVNGDVIGDVNVNDGEVGDNSNEQTGEIEDLVGNNSRNPTLAAVSGQ